MIDTRIVFKCRKCQTERFGDEKVGCGHRVSDYAPTLEINKQVEEYKKAIQEQQNANKVAN